MPSAGPTVASRSLSQESRAWNISIAPCLFSRFCGIHYVRCYFKSKGNLVESIATLTGISVGSAVLVATIASLIHIRKSRASAMRIAALEAEANEHQKQLHKLEAAHLKAKNDLELEHHSLAKRAREEHYNEGFQHGVTSSQKDHLIEITNLRAAHREELAQREAEAEKRGRSMAKLEHEAQVKAFGVEIRPYVKIEKDIGVIWDNHKSHTGYQYQLLVNGIPAFQPHVVVEHSEEIRQVDKEMVAELVKLAQKGAETAAKVYLGGASPGALVIGPEIVQQVKV